MSDSQTSLSNEFDAIGRSLISNQPISDNKKPSSQAQALLDYSADESINGSNDEPNKSAGREKGLPPSVNATAYRIFKILIWLIQEGGLTLDELNKRFLLDPSIGKTLSPDSIWLYLNTLKALGCEILRPTKTNGFKYELKHHPFGVYLDDGHLSVLLSLKSLLEKHASHGMILQFDKVIKKLIRYSALPNREQFLETLFEQNRSIDYEENSTTIKTLNDAIYNSRLLSLTYDSPVKGKESFYFLPNDLMYQQGVLYVLGQQNGRLEPGMLRIDRLKRLDVVERPEIYQRLLELQEQPQKVEIRLYNLQPDDVIDFDMGETLQTATVTNPIDSQQTISAVDITIHTRHLFLLKQKMLASGHLFQILTPKHFADDVTQSLQQMAKQYDYDWDEGSPEK